MKLAISFCHLLSLNFILLTLCVADKVSDDIASGSGDVPVDITTNTTSTSTVVRPTLTVPDVLIPYSTDIDALPPSLSIYVHPQSSSSFSISLDLSVYSDILPSTVFGPPLPQSPSPVASAPAVSQSETISQTTEISATAIIVSQTATAFLFPSNLSPLPSPSSLSLVLYVVSLTRVVEIDQSQVESVIDHIRQSLAELLGLQEANIMYITINLAKQQERTKQRNTSQICFSAIELSVSDFHSTSVKRLQHKIRSGEVVTIQLSADESVQLKDISTPLEETKAPEVRRSSGVTVGIALGTIAAVILLLLSALLIVLLVFKVSRSPESKEISDLRRTYGYHYTSHAMSQWPPRSQSPLI